MKSDQGRLAPAWDVRGVACKFRTLSKHSAEERRWEKGRECSWRSLRRRQDQGGVLFAFKDGGDPELEGILRVRAKAEDGGGRQGKPDGEVS